MIYILITLGYILGGILAVVVAGVRCSLKSEYFYQSDVVLAFIFWWAYLPYLTLTFLFFKSFKILFDIIHKIFKIKINTRFW